MAVRSGRTRIRMPDETLYLKSALLLICMSPSALGSMASGVRGAPDFYRCYAMVLLAVALLWSSTQWVPAITTLDYLGALGLVFSAAAGLLAWRLDGLIVRGIAARTGSAAPAAPKAIVGRSFLPHADAPKTETSRLVQLLLLLSISVMEEFVFRGILLGTASEMSHSVWYGFGIALQAALFCLAHLAFGWPHVAAKAPLAILCTVLAMSISLLSAMAAHAVFNFMFWRGRQ